jgi:hypothetical protein
MYQAYDIETRSHDMEHDLPRAMRTLSGLVAIKLQISPWQSVAVTFQDVVPRRRSC